MEDAELDRDTVIRLTSEIDKFLMELERKHHRVAQFEKDHPGVWINGAEDDFVLAEAIAAWRAAGRNPKSLFTSPDPYLILYRKELTERFGLKVFTFDEAEEYKAALARSTVFEDVITTGDPEASPEYNVPGKKRTEAMETMVGWAATLRKKYPSLN